MTTEEQTVYSHFARQNLWSGLMTNKVAYLGGYLYIFKKAIGIVAQNSCGVVTQKGSLNCGTLTYNLVKSQLPSKQSKHTYFRQTSGFPTPIKINVNPWNTLREI